MEHRAAREPNSVDLCRRRRRRRSPLEIRPSVYLSLRTFGRPIESYSQTRRTSRYREFHTKLVSFSSTGVSRYATLRISGYCFLFCFFIVIIFLCKYRLIFVIFCFHCRFKPIFVMCAWRLLGVCGDKGAALKNVSIIM